MMFHGQKDIKESAVGNGYGGSVVVYLVIVSLSSQRSDDDID